MLGGPKGAGRPGDAYDMPDGFDATGVAGGSTSMHASTNAAAGNGGYEMPVSVQAGQGSHDDGAYDEVKPYDEIDSAAPYDEVINPYAEVDKPYDEVGQNETEL